MGDSSLKVLAERVLQRQSGFASRFRADCVGVPAFPVQQAEHGTHEGCSEQLAEHGTEQRNEPAPSWWWDLFEERAAVREFDGGLSRREAEACAVEDLVQHWLARNPLPAAARANGCVHCGGARADTPILAADGHVWVHQTCWTSLMTHRSGQARAAVHRLLRMTGDFDKSLETSTFSGPTE